MERGFFGNVMGLADSAGGGWKEEFAFQEHRVYATATGREHNILIEIDLAAS